MDPGPFDMFHDPGNEDILTVGDDVHFHFHAHEVSVDEDGVFNALSENDAHVFADIFLVEGDDHVLTAQYVGGTEQNGVAQPFRGGNGFVGGHDGFAFGAFDAVFFQNGVEAFAVFGDVDAVGLGAEDVFAPFIQVFGELDGGLAAEGHDHAEGFFRIENMADIFGSEGLEVEAVGGVEVGGNGFGVVVDQHYFIAGFFQRPYAVNRGVVELDALADADGAGAENDDLFFAGGMFGDELFGFVFFIEGAVEIGGLRGEFPGAGVHHLVDGVGGVFDLFAGEFFDGLIEEPGFLRGHVKLFGELFGFQGFFHFRQLADLR